MPALAPSPPHRRRCRRPPATLRAQRTHALLLICCALGAAACDDPKAPAARELASGPQPLAAPPATTAQRGAPAPADAARDATPTTPTGPSAPAPTASTEEPVLEASRWKLGELHDVGPAAPAAATARGIVLVTRDDHVLRAPLTAPGTFGSIELPREAFARYGHAPAVLGDTVYWMNPAGVVLRGAVGSSAHKVLFEGGRRATRVSAVRVGDRDLVAFIAERDGEPVAMLWASSGEVLQLNPEGTSPTSLTLVATESAPLALFLEGRTSMSPLHARPLRIAQRRVNLAGDAVVWVGPGAVPLTEVHALAASPQQTIALLAMSRTVTEFGLAHVPLDASLSATSAVHWRDYPNGMDPAPVAAAPLCGQGYVVYARPSHAAPHAPQELRLARLEGDHLATEEIVARGRAFNDISIAPRAGGAVLAWTADHRTWALTLACPPS